MIQFPKMLFIKYGGGFIEGIHMHLSSRIGHRRKEESAHLFHQERRLILYQSEDGNFYDPSGHEMKSTFICHNFGCLEK